VRGLCCGTPWKSKGLTRGYEVMAASVLPAVRQASDDGVLPVVLDASSCVDGLREMLAETALDVPVLDAVEFVAEKVLPHLRVEPSDEPLVVHPTCSGERGGSTAALLQIAESISRDVIIPTGWGCCAFAGDRGLLHPELTASATRREAARVRQSTATAYASHNRTCEIGMTKATGRPYQHVLQLLARALAPAG
ncbi:MAG: (Fe-S)-binding protein, partial [Ornithinimicrobium sp.]